MTDHSERHSNGIDVDDWRTPIYRIFPIRRFIELLRTSRNVLVNPSMWDDPFENFFLQCSLIDDSGNPISMQSLARDWYGQCWTTSRESDAMWRIYSPQKDGVRVKTTIEKLFAFFYDDSDQFRSQKYFIGPVRYFTREEIEQQLDKMTFQDFALGGQNSQFARTLLIKRTEFSHETEVRILFNDTHPKVGKEGLASFPLDPGQVFSEVTLDPRLSQDQFSSAKQQIVDAGCTAPIGQSDLYKINRKRIRLSSSTQV